MTPSTPRWIEFVEADTPPGVGRRLRWEDSEVTGDPVAVAAFKARVTEMRELRLQAHGPVPATYEPGWDTAPQFYYSVLSAEIVLGWPWIVEMSLSAKRALSRAASVPPGAIP